MQHGRSWTAEVAAEIAAGTASSAVHSMAHVAAEKDWSNESNLRVQILNKHPKKRFPLTASNPLHRGNSLICLWNSFHSSFYHSCLCLYFFVVAQYTHMTRLF